MEWPSIFPVHCRKFFGKIKQILALQRERLIHWALGVPLLRRLFESTYYREQRAIAGVSEKQGRVRVVIVNTCSGGGGAARAAWRLFDALERQTIDVWMLVLANNGGIKNPRILELKKLCPTAELITDQVPPGMSYDTYFQEGFTGYDIQEALQILDADIVNFHWIGDKFIHFPSVARLGLPTILTLHDQWYATGSCHYTDWSYSGTGYDRCAGNLSGCVGCKRVLTGERDFPERNFAMKKQVYEAIKNLAFVGVSGWTTEEIRRTGVALHARYETIANVIDTDLYAPLPGREAARRELGWESGKKYVLFGTAYELDANKLKGFALLVEALRSLQMQGGLDGVELIALGNRPEVSPVDFCAVHYWGVIQDEKQLARVMGAADVVVVPSYMENLPNMVTEAMACGTPVVAFRVGGIPDIIDHRCDGYLAEPHDTADLARGIAWVLDHGDHAELRKAAREKVERKFTAAQGVQKYLALYRQMLGSKSATNQNLTTSAPVVEESNNAVARYMCYPNANPEQRRAEGGLRLQGKYKRPRSGKPLVSIITVVYNARATLVRTIESVLQQSYDNIEYIVIDGGSTDGSLAIIERYAEHIDYFVSESDGGIYPAMNKGLSLATGDTIAMLNADDWYDPSCVETMVSGYRQKPESVHFGNTVIMNNHQRLASKKEWNQVAPEGILLGNNLSHQALFIPASVYERLGGYDTRYRIAADVEHQVRLFLASVDFVYHDQELVFYGEGGQSGSNGWLLGRLEFLAIIAHYRLEARVALDLTHYPRKFYLSDFFQAVDSVEGALAALDRVRQYLEADDFPTAWKEVSELQKSTLRYLLQQLDDRAQKREACRVSVIVPVYNAEKYLRRCLDSVVNQTLKQIEIIVIDDCSTDGSSVIAQEYAARDDRIKLIKQERNQGQHIGRIDGFLASRGEYLGYVDADDWLELDAMEVAYGWAKVESADVVRFSGQDFRLVNGQMQQGDAGFKATDRLYATGEDYLASPDWYPSMALHLHHRDLWERSLKYFPRERLTGEDNLTCFVLPFFAQRVVSEAAVKYNREQTPGSTTQNHSVQNIMAHIEGRSRIVRLLESFVQEQQASNKLSQRLNSTKADNSSLIKAMIGRLPDDLTRSKLELMARLDREMPLPE